MIRPMRLLAMARKEWTHVRRDIRSLILAFVIPVTLLLLFGYALTLDVDRVPTKIWDQDATPASRELVGRLVGSKYFRIVDFIETDDELVHAIESGTAIAVLTIPAGFGDSIHRDRLVPVQVVLDGSDANTAAIVRSYFNMVSATFTLELRREWAAKRGIDRLNDPVSFQPRVWFNEDLTSKNYIIPGLIAVIMMILAALMTSLTVSKEWETGTMEQLISTPVKPVELVIGKLLPYLAIGAADVLIVVFLGRWLFAVPMRGSYLFLGAISFVFLVGGLMIGMLVSITTKSQLLSSQLSIVITYLPAIMLSGFVYPISSMPLPVEILTHIVPARYFIAILKSIYLKGLGLSMLWVDVLLLTVFAVVMVSVSVRRFQKRLE